jgi:acetate kinase
MAVLRILALNGGSSSFKAGMFEFPGGRTLWEAHDSTLDPLLKRVQAGEADAVGHRIVYGGRAFRETTRITTEMKSELASMAPLDPGHSRIEMEGIESAARLLGSAIPQFAVFDTAFHRTLPPAAYVYPGPFEWLNQGIRRYGFHGISHQYVSQRAAEVLGRDPASLRMITCHLGNGCSLAAVRDGRSVDTTMGFTPLEGLMMGTRSGSVDPGILIHLLRHCGQSPDDLDRILNRESGLLGVSGISGDMREIETAMQQGHARARLAFDVFVHRVCREIGAMLPSLGGLDALVFTGGIGENSAGVRDAVCGRLGFLDLEQVRVMVVPTREELEIAKEVYTALRDAAD